jgi:hypothetical protein
MILRKLAGAIRTLWRDPETFARNLLQYTDPAAFESRLIDVMHPSPLHVHFDPNHDGPVRLNVLDSAWTRTGMTGGPNTVVNLAFRIAQQQGVTVRFVATVKKPEIDANWLRAHAGSLLGKTALPEVPVAWGGDAGAPLRLGPRDMFLATHWTTALQLKAVLPMLPIKKFFYMLQEFEPGFYPWSSNYARACETLGMDFLPIVNERTLADFLFAQKIGRLDDPAVRARAIVFEPAVDGAVFYPRTGQAQQRQKRLVFYARPTNPRNMFGLWVMALREVAADPVFAGWRFEAIGSRGSIGEMALGGGHVLRPAPWMDYAGYGDYLREADLLLCPMLSPHTSYPVLEMAACGGIAITNVFSTKTRESFAELSPNIIAGEATVADLAAGLLEGARRVNAVEARGSLLNIARSWDDTLDPAAARVAEFVSGALADLSS